jgi:nucleotide-binding universal stress UspA family protein
MKRILVPTDFSENSENALKVAAKLARKHKGEIILLHFLELPHAVKDPATSFTDIPEIMFFKKAAINKLEDMMDSDYLEGITVLEAIQFEMAFEGIIKVAKINNVDLICMGSHGASGFKEMFIGSNTEKVVRTSDIPVLIIKKDEHDFDINHMVYASDFSEECKKNFQSVINFSEKIGAHLNLLMVNTPNSFKSTLVAEGQLKNFLSEFAVKNYSTHIFNDANVEKGVLNFARHYKMDLIGISTHGRKGIAHFFNGSISEDVVNHAIRPVVTFKL